MPALGFPFITPPPSRERIAALFRTQRTTDPIGIRIHEALALGAVFFAGWPTTWMEIANAPLAICVLIRLTGHIHIPGPLLWDRTVQALVIWIALLLGSLAWTAGDAHSWVNDIQSLRFTALLPALYMVMERRRELIIALVLGIACGQISQIIQWADIPWLHWHRLPGRNSGWWDPVVGGSVLCAALGLHFAGLAFARTNRGRLCGLVGSIATLLCILATGTRGAAIGAGAVLGFGCILMVTRGILQRSHSRARTIGIVAGAALLFVGVLLALGLPSIRQRMQAGRAEVERAIASGDYSSDTGMRIAAWKWAWLEFASNPAVGVGGGGYRAWAAKHAPDHPDLPAQTLPHAHSMYLHALAVTGLLGAIGLVGAFVLAIRSGLRDPDTRAPLTGYAAGPALALVGLMSAGLFDTIQVNQQTANLMFILFVLCLPSRPPALPPTTRPGAAT